MDDVYFDAVSKVALPSWSAGRVVLLGDAAASVSLFGDGSSLAIADAWARGSGTSAAADAYVAEETLCAAQASASAANRALPSVTTSGAKSASGRSRRADGRQSIRFAD